MVYRPGLQYPLNGLGDGTVHVCGTTSVFQETSNLFREFMYEDLVLNL